MPSFSFRGVSTVQSSLPSPMPARSTASASAPACVELRLAFLFPLELAPYVVSSGWLLPAVVGLEPSLSGSFRHDTLSKSLSIGSLEEWEVSLAQSAAEMGVEFQILLQEEEEKKRRKKRKKK